MAQQIRNGRRNPQEDGMAATTATIHRPSIVNEARELPPTADGWAQCEPTGRACVTCTCGLNTGFIAHAQAVDTLNRHVAHLTPP
ncbi:MAG TPA: hypothetical protein DEQ61_13185 [Streptomyces sp.]|nr:hypothetical protein [Streptomyces sp.]